MSGAKYHELSISLLSEKAEMKARGRRFAGSFFRALSRGRRRAAYDPGEAESDKEEKKECRFSAHVAFDCGSAARMCGRALPFRYVLLE